jgi:uncharacterized protein YwqG
VTDAFEKEDLLNRDQAVQAVRSANLGDAADRACELLRPSIRLIPAGDPLPSTSRFGGSALLPRGMAWPAVDRRDHYTRQLIEVEKQIRVAGVFCPRFLLKTLKERREEYAHLRDAGPLPLSLLVVLELRDLDPALVGLDLPRDGALSVFFDLHSEPWGFDPADKQGWFVVHVPQDQAVFVPPPKDCTITLPTQIRCAPVWSLAPCRLLWKTLKECIKKSKFHEKLADLLADKVSGHGRHRVGGWPDEVQNEMREACQLASHGIDCGSKIDPQDPHVRELLQIDLEEWQLLLQLDTDESIQFADGNTWMWGDSGTLYFWITRTDLAARRFDKVWCILQCY